MQMVLDMVHNDILGGHLGAEKIEAHITDRHWPGVGTEVRRYCTSISYLPVNSACVAV